MKKLYEKYSVKIAMILIVALAIPTVGFTAFKVWDEWGTPLYESEDDLTKPECQTVWTGSKACDPDKFDWGAGIGCRLFKNWGVQEKHVVDSCKNISM